MSNLFKSTFLVAVCLLFSSCLFTGCDKASTGGEIVNNGGGGDEDPDDGNDGDNGQNGDGNGTETPADPDDHADLRNYTLYWADDFDGTELDTSTWEIEVNGDGGGNNELQYYRAENISIGTEPDSGESCLIITARKESYAGKQATSGRLRTAGKMEFQYGRIDARIKPPQTANGLWPAFWMMGNYDEVGWPACGEIDIMELGHTDGISRNIQDRYYNGACHWGPYWSTSYPNYAKFSTAPYSLQDDFHLWTLIWDENALNMYLDLDTYPENAPYYSMDITDKSNENSPGLYFHKPFHVLLNLAVGGSYTGIYNINGVTALDGGEAYMYVDYVRVYKWNQ